MIKKDELIYLHFRILD